MGYYQSGAIAPVQSRIARRFMEPMETIASGLSRGQSSISLYRQGISSQPARVSGVMSWITELIVDIAHILLLVGGLSLLINAIGG